MSEDVLNAAGDQLTFDRAVTTSNSTEASAASGVVCEICRAAIDTEYYYVNASTLCEPCRHLTESAAAVPRGIARFLKAAVFGAGAGLAGAAIYYAVIAITNFEIGLVAILIGYMVGYAVRRGAGGGSRRFQILAITLTYGAVALAYAPIVIKGALEQSSTPASTATAGVPAAATQASDDAPTRLSAGAFFVGLAYLVGFIAILPILVAFTGLSGLISAFIIFIGMQQAWKMTGSPQLQIQGPYRVGTTQVSTPA